MISQFLSSDLSYALAMTLLHSIWQIAVMALILIATLRILRKAPSTHRYLVSVAAMGFSIIVSLVTFSIYYLDASNSILLNAGPTQAFSFPVNSELTSAAGGFELAKNYGAVIVSAWILGSLLFLIRFSGAYIYLIYLIKKAFPAGPSLYGSLKKIKKQFRIHRNIVIKESTIVNSPIVMGFIRPVIIFPVGLINCLSLEETEAILAHELAHIKRHDFIINLIQSFAEILFYYHPGIWYISSRIRFERENCCDDMAISVVGNSVSYAKTLVKLQELNTENFAPAIAFAGSGNEFNQRILRILNLPINSNNMRQKILAFVLVFTTVFAFAKSFAPEEKEVTANNSSPDYFIVEDCPESKEEMFNYVDTIPQKQSLHVTKKSDEEDIELRMEDGEITHLKINGKEVDKEDYDKHKEILSELKPEEHEDLITVFPNCDRITGRIFLKDDKNGMTFRMDSIIELEIEKSREAVQEMRKELKKFRDEDVTQLWHDDKNGELLALELRKQVEKLHDELDMEDDNDFFNWDVNPFHDEHDIRVWALPGKRTVADVLTHNLLKDRLIEKGQTYKLELSGKHLKINGEKQPSNIWKKYKKIYEEETGIELTKKSRIEVDI